MTARVIIGANYGDEGKGTVVATYTKLATSEGKSVLNILTNGGAQRGHTVSTKLGNVTFQHFGSGTYQGANSYYSRYFILNPVQFAKEHKELLVKPKKIFRHPMCRWTTIYDMLANKIELERKKTHDSCCMGVWNTIIRWGPTDVPFTKFMLASEHKRLLYLARIKEYYDQRMTIPSKWKDLWDNPYMAHHFLQDCRYMYEHTEEYNDTIIYNYDEPIFENGQGLALTDNGCNTPDTTPSDTGSSYAVRILSDLGFRSTDVHLYYVSRTYLTRHGDGYLEEEMPRGRVSSSIEEDTANHYNENQGEFRYGKIDYGDVFRRVVRDAGALSYSLVLTHCDEIDNSRDALSHNFETVIKHTPTIEL